MLHSYHRSKPWGDNGHYSKHPHERATQTVAHYKGEETNVAHLPFHCQKWFHCLAHPVSEKTHCLFGFQRND